MNFPAGTRCCLTQKGWVEPGCSPGLAPGLSLLCGGPGHRDTGCLGAIAGSGLGGGADGKPEGGFHATFAAPAPGFSVSDHASVYF